MNNFSKIAAALLLAGMSLSAAAAEDSQWFVRAEIGNTDIETDLGDLDDDSYSVRAGYFFRPTVAIEGFYTNYGEDRTEGASAELTGFGVGVVGKHHFGPSEGLFVSGRVGAVRTEADFRVDEFDSGSDSSIRGYIGVGLGYDFTPDFGLSVNYDYTKADAFDFDADLETTSLGIEYRF